MVLNLPLKKGLRWELELIFSPPPLPAFPIMKL